MTDAIRTALRADEACRLKPYLDTVGVLTIGWGHNLTRGISQRVADLIFEDDLESAAADCRKWAWFDGLDPVRQGVVLNMVFNMGRTRVQGFGQMIAAIKAGRFDVAAAEMLDSRWARQVGARATRLARQMRSGIA